MKYTLFFATLAIAACLVGAAPTDDDDKDYTDLVIKSCDGDNTGAKVDFLKCKNYPPKISDSSIDVYFQGTSPQTVDQGDEMIVTAYLGSLQVFTQKYDMCAEAKKSGAECPLQGGKTMKMKSSSPIPKGIPVPPGVGIKLVARAVSKSGAPIYCVETSVKFRSG